MKRVLFIIMAFFCCALTAQDKNYLDHHELSLDFGSMRNRYIYPITNIRYTSPLFLKEKLKCSLRLRSYGSWYLYSPSAYDLSPLLEYFFEHDKDRYYYSAGAGLDTRLRFIHDERSAAQSSAEPFISLAAHFKMKRFVQHYPLWTRFYSDGISFTWQPELNFELGKKVFLMGRYELGFIKLYSHPSHEWRHDFFIGLQYILK
jgi:hypothetical protein